MPARDGGEPSFDQLSAGTDFGLNHWRPACPARQRRLRGSCGESRGQELSVACLTIARQRQVQPGALSEV